MIRSDSYRDIDLTRNMTKRLCEVSSIASLHCDSCCIINCRPISVLAVFQGTAVQGSSFLGWTKWTQLLLDWTGLGSPRLSSLSVLTLQYFSFILLCLLDCDLLMAVLSISEMIGQWIWKHWLNVTLVNIVFVTWKIIYVYYVFFQADFKYVIRIASSQNNFFVADVLKCSFTEFGSFWSVCQFVLNMVQALYYILSTLRAWKLSHNEDSRHVSPIIDRQTDCKLGHVPTETQEKHGERFNQDIPPWKSDTKASGVALWWLNTAGHLGKTLHTQNVAESQPLLLFM